MGLVENKIVALATDVYSSDLLWKKFARNQRRANSMANRTVARRSKREEEPGGAGDSDIRGRASLVLEAERKASASSELEDSGIPAGIDLEMETTEP
jgi:hypothetical protein